MAAFGGASGAEYRGTSTKLPGPYTWLGTGGGGRFFSRFSVLFNGFFMFFPTVSWFYKGFYIDVLGFFGYVFLWFLEDFFFLKVFVVVYVWVCCIKVFMEGSKGLLSMFQRFCFSGIFSGPCYDRLCFFLEGSKGLSSMFQRFCFSGNFSGPCYDRLCFFYFVLGFSKK